jgi:hypothetical protein
MAKESQGGPGSSDQMVIELLQKQIKNLEQERDSLRDELARERTRIERLTERAVSAETRADMLAKTLNDKQVGAPATISEEPEDRTSVAASSVQAPASKAAAEQTAEQRRRQRAAKSKWWEFWKRWEPQEPWGKGQSR